MILRRGWPAVLLCFAVCMAPIPLHAQLTDNLGGLTDENLDGYLGPLKTGLSGSMNSAIFRTGDVPLMGVNISIGLSAMAIEYDAEDKTYMPADPAGFTSLVPSEVPTVVGALGGMIVEGQDGLAQVYPGGFDLDGFSIAVPELSIGSFLGTRALIRYIALDLGDSELGDFRYFGIGAQHSISQWLPLLPVDLAAGFFVQGFKIGDDVVNAKATQLNVTASKKFTFLQPYVGLGYDSLQLDAKYEDDDDPELNFDVGLEKETNSHLTLGVLGRIAFLSVFFEYNSGAATGLALGFSLGT